MGMAATVGDERFRKADRVWHRWRARNLPPGSEGYALLHTPGDRIKVAHAPLLAPPPRAAVAFEPAAAEVFHYDIRPLDFGYRLAEVLFEGRRVDVVRRTLQP